MQPQVRVGCTVVKFEFQVHQRIVDCRSERSDTGMRKASFAVANSAPRNQFNLQILWQASSQFEISNLSVSCSA